MDDEATYGDEEMYDYTNECDNCYAEDCDGCMFYDEEDW